MNRSAERHVDQPLMLTPDVIAVRCQRDDLTSRAVEDTMLILDRAQGQIHQLNATARFIWQQCDGSRPLRAIVALLVETFAIDDASAERDVRLTIQHFYDLGLVRIQTP